MYPHERSLVERYKGRPFVLVGVNSDPEPEMARAVAAQHGHNWRSFWDGPGGPIAAQWKVSAWPCIHVIDARGVLRFAQLRGDELDPAIDMLLREMESPPRATPASQGRY